VRPAVFIVAFFMGLVRPSDIGVRNAVIAATMPAPLLAKAIGIERVSMDGARVVGALKWPVPREIGLEQCGDEVDSPALACVPAPSRHSLSLNGDTPPRDDPAGLPMGVLHACL